MVIAEIGSTPYKIMLLIHIASAFVAFAPAFVWPFVSVKLKKAGEPVGPTINRLAAGNTLKIHGPAYVITGFVGFGLAGMSEKVFRMSQTWLSLAALLWFVGMGIMFGLMNPAEKKAAEGDADAEKQLAMYGGILHLILFVALFLMIWKPGL
jgi:uncharacterized membrane protein